MDPKCIKAIVTGGASGIGKAICNVVVEGGGKVCIIDVAEDNGKEVANELNKGKPERVAFFIKGDVADYGGLEESFIIAKGELGGLNVVYNNAGIIGDTKKLININVLGVINGTYIGLSLMSRTKGGEGGVIINTASAITFIPGVPLASYNASKSAIFAFTKSVVSFEDFSDHGVRINSVCPGGVDTPFIDLMIGEPESYLPKAAVVDMAKQVTEFKTLIDYYKYSMGLLTPREVAQTFYQLTLDKHISMGKSVLVWPGKSGLVVDMVPMVTGKLGDEEEFQEPEVLKLN